MKLEKGDVLLHRHYGLGINYCIYNDLYPTDDFTPRLNVLSGDREPFTIKTAHILYNLGQIKGEISLEYLRENFSMYFI